MDLFGPNSYKSLSGNSFGLVIVDYFSRFTWVFFLDDKSQVQKIFKNFAKKAQNQFEVKIKKVRSDNGTEFKNANVDTFLDDEGISHEFSATTHLNKMELLIGRIGRSSKWRERCLMSTRHRSTFGLKRLRQLVMQQIACIFTSYSARWHTSSSLVTNPKLDTFRYSAQRVTFLTSIIVRNFLLSLMKVSYSVMAQTLILTVSTTTSPERLNIR